MADQSAPNTVMGAIVAFGLMASAAMLKWLPARKKSREENLATIEEIHAKGAEANLDRYQKDLALLRQELEEMRSANLTLHDKVARLTWENSNLTAQVAALAAQIEQFKKTKC